MDRLGGSHQNEKYPRLRQRKLPRPLGQDRTQGTQGIVGSDVGSNVDFVVEPELSSEHVLAHLFGMKLNAALLRSGERIAVQMEA